MIDRTDEFPAAIIADLACEVFRMDEAHPDGYPATRDGVFLGIMTAVHELETEAIESWRSERTPCLAPNGRTHCHWPYTRQELLQAAAIIIRTIRSIDLAETLP